VNATITLISFDLDIASLSQDDCLRLQTVFCVSTLKHLRIYCPSSDQRLLDTFSQVIDYLP